MSSSKSSTFFFAPPAPLLPAGAPAPAVSRRAGVPPPLALNSTSPPLLSRLQPTLDVHRAAFLQIFTGDLGLAPEQDDAVPLGALLLFAALVLPLLARRDV